ncbi:MAG: sugar ABC transporter permease [Lacrimispora sp.]|uniref:carbohydrate ABC transporter permease n=1 Tax=Lacrimispora sp. TaxID=2719234 RepID=UPI0039E55AC1
MEERKNRSPLQNKAIKRNLQAYSFLLPNLILFTACSLYPVVWTLKYVFYQYGGYGTGAPRFTGLANLARVFRDKVYWESVLHTFTYGFGKVVIIIPLAFFLAFLLNQQKRGNGAAQSIMFLPTIMSSAVMGLVFYLLFNAYNGEVNKYLLEAGIITRPINWLGKGHAMKTLIITAVWGGVGNYMVYFIAGIQQVSGDAIESARIDGAGKLQTIWYIIVPMLGPILKIIMMLAITSAFNDITNVMVLTEGGPNNATMVMSLYGYRYFFPISAAEATVPQYGYGAAVSVVSAAIAGTVTVIYLKVSKKLDDIY